MGQLDGSMARWMGLVGLDCRPGRKDWLPRMGAMLSLLCLLSSVTTASAQTQKPGWSMNVSRVVTATPQSDATLPCSVSHPNKGYNGNITVIWRRLCVEIFKCMTLTSSATCVNPVKGNFGLIGMPREGDLTLQIKNVSYQDSTSYICRIELENKEDAFESRLGTILLVSDAEPEPRPAACPVCPSQKITIIALGVLSGLLFIALLLMLAHALWNKRGKKTRKPAANAKSSSSPPPIPLETPSPTPVYENIPRGLKPRKAETSQ